MDTDYSFTLHVTSPTWPTHFCETSISAPCLEPHPHQPNDIRHKNHRRLACCHSQARSNIHTNSLTLARTHIHTNSLSLTLSLTLARTHIHTNSLSLSNSGTHTHTHQLSLRNSVKWLKWCKRAVVNQTNTGTVSKAPPGNLRREGVECVYLDFPERLDAILNWTGLTCTVHAHTIPSQNIHDNDAAGVPHSKPCFLAPFLQTLTGYAAEGALFILAQLSTEIVSAGFMLSEPSIKLWKVLSAKQHSINACR